MKTDAPAPRARPDLQAFAGIDSDAALRRLASSRAGLSAGEASARLARYGPNAVGDERRRHPVLAFLGQFAAPLPLLLLALATVDLFKIGRAHV